MNKRQAAAQFKRKHVSGEAFTQKEAEQYLDEWAMFENDAISFNRYIELSQFETKSGRTELIEWMGRNGR